MTEPPPPWTLRCVDVTVRRGRRDLLRNINLTVHAGDCLALVGPNGAGKTTLLKTLLGLVRPTAGAVLLDEVPLHTLSARQRGRFAAYVPQTLDAVPAFRVREVVAGGRHPHHAPFGRLRAADHAAIARALAACGLATLAERTFDTLSGGERQKTLIAAALAQEPAALLLDEPASALDPAVQLELVGILRAWHTAGRALVLVSHDLQWPAALGGRVVALRDGQIAAEGPAADVLTPARLGAIYDATFAAVTTPSGRQLVLPQWWGP